MSKADDLRRDVQGVNKAITAVEEMTVPKEFRYDDVMIARNCLMEIRSRMMQEIRLIETGIPKDSPRGPGLHTAANRPPEPEAFRAGFEATEVDVVVPEEVVEAASVTSAEPEPPEVTVTVTPVEPEDSGEFWTLEDIEPLNRSELMKVAKEEGIKFTVKDTRDTLYKKVKKGLGL